jgi:CRISPR-associated protein Csm4
LCWAALERFGRARLEALLDGYTRERPFVVVADGVPAGFLPRPSVPDAVLGRAVDPQQRKLARKRIWLPAGEAQLPLAKWLDAAQAAAPGKTAVLTQNTINRLTGTTGELQFAPRQVERDAFAADARLDVHVVLDETRLEVGQLRQLFEDIGAVGYGRDASTGPGKFAVEALDEHGWGAAVASYWLTLAPCAPEPAVLDAARCYYHPVTRFGRHGNVGVRLGVPFKRPLLLLKTGALLRSREPATWLMHGCGLGGRNAPLSAVIPGTVHQGYAPVVPLNLEPAP